MLDEPKAEQIKGNFTLPRKVDFSTMMVKTRIATCKVCGRQQKILGKTERDRLAETQNGAE